MAQRIAATDAESFPEELRKHPRVLVVDADPEVGTFLTSRLRKMGVDTLLAHDAAQAYRMACNDAPSVIMLNYPMPNGESHYLLSRLRSTAATDSVPIFVMSEGRLDEATESDLRRDICGHRGVAQFFKKPLDTEALFPALQKFCAFMLPRPVDSF